MKWHASRCKWCSKTFTQAGWYNNHLEKAHPGKNVSGKRRLSDSDGDPDMSEITSNLPPDLFSESSDIEPQDEGSDREELEFSSDESDSDEPENNTEIYPNAGTPIRAHSFPEQDPAYNLYAPFHHVTDYRLARFFNAAKTSQSKIDQFFKDGILKAINPTYKVQFRSAYTLLNIVDTAASEPCWYEGRVNYPLQTGVGFRYRNIISVVEYLLGQKPYERDMLWGPTREYNKEGERVYNEINTGTWWEDNQALLPEGATLIPILLASDETHLTNFSGDKKLWPVYMSIGNIRSSIRNTHTMHAWVPIAFLPIAPKRVNKIPGYSVETQEIQALQTVHDILTRLLKPLSGSACQTGVEMVCADGNVRLCFPKLFCWLADHMENATIHGISNNRCPICVSPTDRLGEYLEAGFPTRVHEDYAVAYSQSDTTGLSAHGVKNIKNALWSVPQVNPPDLVRADILHNILLGVLNHMMDWIQGFLEHHDRINAFDHIWRRLPPYPGFAVPKKAYRSVSQWSGKEMRDFAKVILGNFTAALRRKSGQSRTNAYQLNEFTKAIRCVRNLTDFYLMTQYSSHTELTISYLQKYLRVFHETKDVFLRFRADKKTKRAAAEAHKNLLKEQTLYVSEQELTVSERTKMRQEDTLERRDLMNEILREGAHYNFPKIHLISHYAEQIKRFGALGQYSTDISEAMHKGLKDAYRRSNRVNSMDQIITTYTRDHTFAMKDLSIKAWTRVREEDNEAHDVGSERRKNRVFLKLEGRLALETVSNLQDLALYIGINVKLATRAFLIRELKDIDFDVELDLQWLLDSDIMAYTCLAIPVPKLSGEGFVWHHVRCTGLTGFRGGGERNDWVWIRHSAADSERAGTLNGRIPGRLNSLFKLTDKQGVVYRLAHVSLLKCIGSTAVQGVEGMVRVGWPTNKEDKVVRIAQIEGMAHLIPLEPEESWFINNRIDLETWNTIYD